MCSSHDGGGKSRGGKIMYNYSNFLNKGGEQSTNGGRSKNQENNDGGESASQLVIPNQVSFHKQKNVPISN